LLIIDTKEKISYADSYLDTAVRSYDVL